jgi:3'(2'), 5'-bisphosphate nucleotidase
MTPDDLLALAARLARQAAAAVMAVRDGGFAVERKRDDSPVTAADRIAEALIVEGLRAAAPTIPVIAEEAHEAGEVTATPGARFWLVDPLDGTREFAAGLDTFAINIGLVEEGRPRLGVVALPATGELFGGTIGQGAWKEDAGGTRHAIRVRRIPAEGPVVMASRHYQKDPRIAEFAAAHRAQSVVNIGSAAKFCRVAEGTADLYPRFGPTMEWDTAAPEAVVVAAGGTITELDGQLLRYGKPGWGNPPFIVRGLP